MIRPTKVSTFGCFDAVLISSPAPNHHRTPPYPFWSPLRGRFRMHSFNSLVCFFFFSQGGIPGGGTSEVSELNRAVNIRDFSPSPSFAFASKQKFLSFSLSLFLSISIFFFSFWLYHRKILSCLREEKRKKNPERCLLSYEHLDVGGDEFHQMSLRQHLGPVYIQVTYR